VLPAEGDRAAYLIFEARDQRVAGSSGCNRVTGSYTIEGSMLRFGPTAGTRMACSTQLMEQEQAFFNALEATNGFRIADGQLELRDGDRQLVAKFRRES
jgi:heat shock protein HslJ